MKTKVVLRDMNDDLGSRYLDAAIAANGDVVISGVDRGDGVEQAFGAGRREYEWAWTVAAADVTVLATALGAAGDVLAVLAERFSGDDAAGLGEFLDESGVPVERRSRIGD